MSQRAQQTHLSLPEELTPSSLTVWTVTPGAAERHPEPYDDGFPTPCFALADGSEFAYGAAPSVDDYGDFAGDELNDEVTALVGDAELIDCSADPVLSDAAPVRESLLPLSVDVWPWNGLESTAQHLQHSEPEPPESYVRELSPVLLVAQIEEAARRLAPVIRFAALEEATPGPASSPVSTVRRVIHPALDPATPLEDPPVGRPPQISLLLWLRLAATCSWL